MVMPKKARGRERTAPPSSPGSFGAAQVFVQHLTDQADGYPISPSWYGWAVREAFLVDLTWPQPVPTSADLRTQGDSREACPLCNAADVTSRRLPIDLYDHAGAPVRRIPQAIFHTCGCCGAGWYDEGADAGPGVPIVEPVVPVYDASDD